MPRNDDPGQPMECHESMHFVMPILDQPGRLPKVENAAEVDAAIDAFFVSFNKATV